MGCCEEILGSVPVIGCYCFCGGVPLVLFLMQTTHIVLAVAFLGTLVCGVPRGTEVPKIPCPSEVSDKCPSVDGPTPVYLAHPNDCTKFCVCDDQVAFEQDCMKGLVFDEVIHVCNWPYNVDCGTRPIPPN
ncbi:hypothetical protein O3P69_005105 [Scylla paramamosain]|uniref:Chitin-binding type-2 domain-containing protein n=1 Tax=Scylla paramamosain TaxID=85552 RepID=A0AAW0UDY7_SCYPA